MSFTLKLSVQAATLLRPHAPRDEKLKMVAGEGDLSPADRVTVLYFLASDHDREVREGARKALAEIPEHDLRQAVSSPDLHPRVLNALARLYHRFHHLAESLATHPNCDDATRDFLSGKGIVVFSPNSGNVSAHQEEGETGEEDFAETDEPVDEESEAFRSKYQLAQTMGVAEKIKIAQTGDKEWRMILIKDSNKLVSGTVIRNPRMTESEVLTIAKSAIQNDEILRVICANKEWVKNYQIRKALVENTKTPLPTSLRLLATLGEKDLAHIAKSKNISSVLSTQAKKLVMAKKKD